MPKNDVYECPGCGYKYYSTTDQCCKYCGSDNPNYDERGANAAPASAPANASSQTAYSAPQRTQSEFNGCLFAVLLILFWPGAIIYAIVCNSHK